MKVCKFKRREVVIAVLVALTGGTFTPSVTAVTVHDPISNAKRMAEAVKQMNEYVKQYQVFVSQLQQAQATYKAITGIRTVGGLFMAMNNRLIYNSLPPDAQLLVGDTSKLIGSFSALQHNIDAAKLRTIQLTGGAFRSDPYGRVSWDQAVNTIGAQYGVGDTIYRNSTVHAQTIEHLILAIGTAGDPAAIAALNTRIAGEQASLQNLANQMVAYQMMQMAEQRILELRSIDRVRMMGSQPPVGRILGP